AQETVDIHSRYGLSPTAYLHSCGLFERPVTAAHCVHLTSADIDILAAADAGVAHNPGSNLKLGSGIADLPALLRSGMRIGLGTDGAASNNKLDMFEEMRLAALLHKGVAQDATLIPAQAALMLATEGGARALFLETGLGTLLPDAPADLVLLDIAGPRYAPEHNLLSHVVYASGAQDVTDVFVAGKHIYAGREFLTLDRERIVHDANRAGLRLTAAAQARAGSTQ
ncbi:MAG: amidohydrolase family protein, partial [Firmicutes bacterium]|nr:amidohydrolase family protein [Bacillota bacterium]